MKRLLAITLAILMVFSFAACSKEESYDYSAKSEGVMTYAQFKEAALDSSVVIEAYVQEKQAYSAAYGNTCLYLQDPDGAYFVYRLACDQTAYDAIKVGSKVKVTGTKAEWQGEVEIADATLEVVDTEHTWAATALDATELFGKDELESHVNELISAKATVTGVSAKQSDDDPDLYIDVEVNGNAYSFCVESQLRGQDTDAYKAAAALQAGDVVTFTGFNYWYSAPNMHITAVTK